MSETSDARREAEGGPLALVRPVLESRGFACAESHHGVSSGGAFAAATFRRGVLEIGLIIRNGRSLGCPNYSAGDGYVGHEDLVWALGRTGEERLVPGEWLAYQDRGGGDAVEALRVDLERIILPTLDASEAQFRLALHRARKRLQETRGR